MKEKFKTSIPAMAPLGKPACAVPTHGHDQTLPSQPMHSAAAGSAVYQEVRLAFEPPRVASESPWQADGILLVEGMVVVSVAAPLWAIDHFRCLNRSHIRLHEGVNADWGTRHHIHGEQEVQVAQVACWAVVQCWQCLWTVTDFARGLQLLRPLLLLMEPRGEIVHVA